MRSAGRVRLGAESPGLGSAYWAEIRQLAASWAEQTALEQGLPALIEDEATLQEVATLLCAGRDDPGGIRPAKRG